MNLFYPQASGDRFLTSIIVQDPPGIDDEVRKNWKRGLKIDCIGLGLVSIGLKMPHLSAYLRSTGSFAKRPMHVVSDCRILLRSRSIFKVRAFKPWRRGEVHVG